MLQHGWSTRHRILKSYLSHGGYSVSPEWSSFSKYVIGFLSFPLVAKGTTVLFEQISKRWDAATTAKRIVATQLDPILKAADELHGKLRSLAEEDFREFRELARGAAVEGTDLINLCSTVFLFAQFWGRLEILRRVSLHAELTRDKRGKLLIDFLRCLESRRVRLVDRAWQRAIGELTFTDAKPFSDLISFKEFVEMYENNARVREWVTPLEKLLRETRYRDSRQQMLYYGIIVQAMIDTLDPKHSTTRERPSYPNKLSRRAKRTLIGRDFGVYLKDVKNTEKYTGIKRSKT